MSIASRVAANPFLAAMKDVIMQEVWAGFEDVKGVDVPVHLSILHVPVNLNVKLGDLRPLVEILSGETEAQYLASQQPPAPVVIPAGSTTA